MGVFKWPYRVLFQDTMAYGWHHFLTNFKFQCEAREHLFFQYWLTSPEARAENQDLVLLTHEGYSRNLAPVGVGDTVGILLTQEDAGPSSVRMCFRVVRSDGAPVCCGYQTLVSTNRAGAIIPASKEMRRFGLAFREKLTEPSFAERVTSGLGLDRIFDEASIKAGQETAAGSREGSLPASLARTVPENALVFTFPGTGSSHPRLLADLAARDFLGQGRLVQRAEEVSRDLLGASLRGLIEDGDPAEVLRANPGLSQILIYLANVIPAVWLQEKGVRPDILVGHSLGEIASLALGGAMSLETGLLAVGERARALREAKSPGGMLILFCHAKSARALLDVLGRTSLDIAVVNLPEQTVVSGNEKDLERLCAAATHTGITFSRLNSAYPFHSRLLEPCVAPFASALQALRLAAPTGPVFSPMERDFWSADDDLAGLLASHFVRPLAFADVLRDLHELGARRFVECGGGRALSGLVSKALPGKGVRTASTLQGPPEAAFIEALEVCGVETSPSPVSTRPTPVPVSPQPTISRQAAEPPTDLDLPIAIVGIGCVLPDALDPEHLWRNILARKVAITDRPSHDLRDYFAEGEGTTPDKTYSRLSAWVRGFDPDGVLGAFPTFAQRLLGAAILQSLKDARPDPRRAQLLVGSTADGCREYDTALMLAGLSRMTTASGSHPKDAEASLQALEAALGQSRETCVDLSPWPLFHAVGEQLVGPGLKVLAFDAACASSLYAITAGVRNLRRGECDVVLAGGVFSPGAPNASLFAQFRGLSTNGSRPFDAQADGVVFSEGAAILALKRLPDALASGDRVLGVIRGYGCSSDGKSASVMEPREAGQLLAVKRAHQAAQVDPATIQYLEAHATATAVGDAVEVKAAAKLLPGSGNGVSLGSLKANIGHSGWTAGSASMVKVVQALNTHTIPAQAAFDEPSARLELAKSVFRIPKTAAAWPPNVKGEPRRAGVNGFGFGGSNAHVVVEEFEPAYHAAFANRTPAKRPMEPVAVTAISFLRPKDGVRFSADELVLPGKVRILPDVLDHMDDGQVLAIHVAHHALKSLPGWEALAEETGVILGVEGKTGRGIDAALRVSRDHVTRRLKEAGKRALAEKISTSLDALLPSGPFTLLGMMPNVIAGRVSNTFNLKGPNLVLDAHRASLAESIEFARSLIEQGECRLVLAGAISGHAHPAVSTLVETSRVHREPRSIAEAAFVLALTPLSLAKEKGWNVLAVLEEQPRASRNLVAVGADRFCLLGAEGAPEIAKAIEAAGRGEAATVVWPSGAELGIAPGDRAATPLVHRPRTEASASPADDLVAAAIALVENPAPSGPRHALRGRKVLVVSDQPGWCRSEASRRLLNGLDHRFVVPKGSVLQGAFELDLTNEKTLATGLAALPDYDVILAVGDVASEDLESVEGRPLLELLFAVARHAYHRLVKGEVSLAALVLGGHLPGEQLHPLTGLLSGFAKSLARELPQARIKVVVADEIDVLENLGRLEVELGTPGWPVEVVFREGRRFSHQLVRTDALAIGEAVAPSGVVVATGGARGVTAVLVEAMLDCGSSAVLLGRSDPQAVPAELVELDEAAFAAREPLFYETELAKGGRLPELKKRWQALASAREVAVNLRKLKARPGARVSYRICDVLDPAQVDSVVAGIVADHGRIDLVIHGAGVQTSKLLTKRTLSEFRTVLATKIDGLGNIRRSCLRHVHGARPQFHVVSSVAGFAGNPGQADYAAANDALVRFVGCLSVKSGESDWSAIAWPGWDGIGMASGSEYAAIAAATGQRWISREEGKQFFAAVMKGRPALSVLAPIRERDLKALGLTLADAPGPLAAAVHCPLSLESHPFLSQHLVKGAPTVPGAYLLDLAGQAALSMRPGWRVVGFSEATFERFVKVPARGTTLTVLLRVVGENSRETLVHARVVSDFTHASGVTLQKGIEHAASFVVVAPSGAPLGATRKEDLTGQAIELEDPYQSHDSPVRLAGPFGAIRRVACRPGTTSAHFRPVEALSQGPAVLPVLLLDALFRVAGTCTRDGLVPISVPVACSRLEISDQPFQEPGFLLGAAARFDGDIAMMDWGEAHAPDGRLLLRFTGGLARRVGNVVESRLSPSSLYQ
jgi:acyl transferase domain-containing protein/NAD(P)-dependent dehydrogenase (short-subunit alcohol dehydrogenase family)/acyl-CoA thioesterase FadM